MQIILDISDQAKAYDYLIDTLACLSKQTKKYKILVNREDSWKTLILDLNKVFQLDLHFQANELSELVKGEDSVVITGNMEFSSEYGEVMESMIDKYPDRLVSGITCKYTCLSKSFHYPNDSHLSEIIHKREEFSLHRSFVNAYNIGFSKNIKLEEIDNLDTVSHGTLVAYST